MFLFIFRKLRYQNRFSVGYGDIGTPYPWKVFFENIVGSGDGHWDDGTSGFLCNLEGTFFERLYRGRLIFLLVATALRKDADGNTGFDIINGGENYLESLFDIFSVKEEAVEPLHNHAQYRHFVDTVFGNVPGQIRTKLISHNNVKETPVIADV